MKQLVAIYFGDPEFVLHAGLESVRMEDIYLTLIFQGLEMANTGLQNEWHIFVWNLAGNSIKKLSLFRILEQAKSTNQVLSPTISLKLLRIVQI